MKAALPSGEVAITGTCRVYLIGAYLLLMACGVFGSRQAAACTPRIIAPHEPIFWSGFVSFSGKFAEPALLPANAKGVLYQMMDSSTVPVFRMFKGTRHVAVPTRTLRITAMDNIDKSAAIEPLADRKVVFYRIDPVQPFEAGTVYHVTSSLGDASYIGVSNTAVDVSRIRFVQAGQSNKETVYSAFGCSALRGRVGIVQQFAFSVPPEYAPFRSLIFAVPYNRGGVSWHALPDKESAYPGELDGEQHAFGLQDRVAYFHFEKTSGQIHSAINASIAFLEIDDAWHDTAAIAFAVAPDKVEAFDSLAYLQNALNAKATAAIYRCLDELPIRSTDFPLDSQSDSSYALAGWVERTVSSARSNIRRTALVKLLRELSRNPDTTIRAKATAALRRVGG